MDDHHATMRGILASPFRDLPAPLPRRLLKNAAMTASVITIAACGELATVGTAPEATSQSQSQSQSTQDSSTTVASSTSATQGTGSTGSTGSTGTTGGTSGSDAGGSTGGDTGTGGSTTDPGGSTTDPGTTPPADNQPVANGDNFNVPGDTETELDVLANDAGLQDSPVAIAVIGDALNGTVSLSGNGFSYTPDPGYSGTDSFTYRVTDGDGDFDTATVDLFVIAAPVPGVVALQGYGTASTFGGGTGHESCIVTNLNDAGAGSFRNCVENRNGPTASPTPRTVTFDVGGTIVLQTDLRIRQPFLTIDGLDAPSPGITFSRSSGANGEFKINTFSGQNTCAHDLLIQGVRFLGVWDGTQNTSNNASTLVIDGEDLPNCIQNVVLSRVTVFNAQDSGGDMWGSMSDITVQYSAFLESLHPMTISHSGGSQSRERISLHHNLFAYVHERGPQIRGAVRDLNMDQNIGHKWAAFGFGGGYLTRVRCVSGACPERLNLVENHWSSGGGALNAALIIAETAGNDSDEATIAPEVFMQGNRLPSQNIDAGTASSAFARSAEANITLFADNELVSDVLPNIGMPFRNAAENAIFSEVAIQIAADL